MNDFERGFTEELQKIAKDRSQLGLERVERKVDLLTSLLVGGGAGALAGKLIHPKGALPGAAVGATAAGAGTLIGGLMGRKAEQRRQRNE